MQLRPTELRCLTVIRALQRNGRRISERQIAQRGGLPLPRVHAAMKSLVGRGLLGRDGTPKN
jgi:DNA-binding IclR family transcriptional regulator